MNSNYRFYTYHYRILERMLKKTWIVFLFFELGIVAYFMLQFGMRYGMQFAESIIIMDIIGGAIGKIYEFKLGKILEIHAEGLYVYDYRGRYEKQIPWALVKSLEIVDIAKSKHNGMEIHLFDGTNYLCIEDRHAMELIVDNSNAVVINPNRNIQDEKNKLYNIIGVVVILSTIVIVVAWVLFELFR